MAELLGQVGGVGGGLLGLLLGVLQLGDGVIHIGLHGLEVLLELSLGTGQHGVLSGELLNALGGVVQLDLGGLLRAVGSLQRDAHLFQFGSEHVATALGHVVSLAGLLAGALLLLQGGSELLDLSQVFLDLLHGLGIGAVGVIQGHLQLVDVGLELLLHAESLLLGLGLGLEGSLHGFEGAGVVLARVLEFLLLLGEAAVDLLADLGELELSADDLSLLLLEGGFGLLEGGLKLLLLHLETAAGLVELVDGLATLAELVGEVVDLVGEELVLALESFDVLLGLLVLGLELEELGGVGLGLGLAGDELGGKVLAFGLPLGDELVELTLLLLHGGGVGVGALNVNHEILDLASETVLGLLEGSALAERLLDLLLGLGELGGKLALGLLELLGASDTFLLVLGAPHLGLGGGLGEGSLHFGLEFDFLLEGLLDGIEIGLGVLEGGSQGGLGAGLLLESALGVLELVSELLSELGKSADLVLGILQLAEELAVLGLEALFGGGKLGDHASMLLDLDGAVGQLELELLGKLLGGGLGLDDAVVLLGEVQQLAGKTLLLLLQVVLELLELIDLVAHLADGILVLLAEGGGGGLLVEVGLLEVAAKTRQLLLSLLVELNLSGGGATGLVEALGELVQFLGQVGSLLLDLCASLTLGFELLLDLLDAGGELLDLLAGLVDGGLLVFELGDEGSVLEVLALGGLVHVALDALQVVLELVQGGLELSLDLGQVVDLVLLRLEVIGGFPVALLHLLLLAGELGNELILLGHLILEGLDLMLLGILLLFGLSQGPLEVLDVLLELAGFGGELLLVGAERGAGILLIHQALLDVLEGRLDVDLLGHHGVESGLGIASDGALGLKLKVDFILFLESDDVGSLEFLDQILTLSNGLLHRGQLSNDFFIFVLHFDCCVLCSVVTLSFTGGRLDVVVG